MTREDLERFRDKQKWINSRIKFYEEQKLNVARLNSVLSDMPKGSREVYDNEAESLTCLMDQINELIKESSENVIKAEKEIMEQLNQLSSDKYKTVLYNFYILGNSIKSIARQIHYDRKYTYEIKQKALKEFDELGKKLKKKEETEN